MGSSRLWILTASVLLIAGACGSTGDVSNVDNSAGSEFNWVPVQPLTRDLFHTYVFIANATPVAPGTDPSREIDPADADRFFAQICNGELLTLFGSRSAYPSQAAAYERLFNLVEGLCPVSPTYLDRVRGEVAWHMTRNELTLNRMLGSDEKSVSDFCSLLQASQNLTAAVVASAATRVGLVGEADADVVEVGVSVLIQACPEILEFFQGH